MQARGSFLALEVAQAIAGASLADAMARASAPRVGSGSAVSDGREIDRTRGLAMAAPVSRQWKGYWKR